MRRTAGMLLGALALVSTVAARESDGTLDVLRAPNDGAPAVVVAGGTFTARASREVQVRLMGEAGSLEIVAQWKPLPSGFVEAECRVPDGAPPGAYALDAGGADISRRAVFVFDEFPDAYVVAHVADVRIGAEDAAFRSIVQAVNESEAALVVVTGDLTEHGAPEEYLRFLSVLDTCSKPTFVCAGARDKPDKEYGRFFGRGPNVFAFGADGYLVFDTARPAPVAGLDARGGELYVARRAIRAARWSIGFTHRYGPEMEPRDQITLFVDDPLDYLMCGASRQESRADDGVVPWGRTRIITTPTAVDGAFRLVDVTQQGVLPRPVTSVNAHP